jgi:hypothetical protein
MYHEYLQQLQTEFDRQTSNLIHKGYPEAANQSVAAFLQHIEPLKEHLGELPLVETDFEKGRLPFVIVIKSDWMPVETAMSLVAYAGKNGVTKLYPREPADFAIIDEVHLPDSLAYLLVDIDRGQETINRSPAEAMQMIKNENRSPLTIDEGIAIVTQYPQFLIKNNCFSLLASRYSRDKCVPAIWINGAKQANLGWCWDGNPHTWLGSASCHSRI